MYTLSYEFFETAKTVYISRDSIGKSEEGIDIPAVAGLRWSHQIHEECVGSWFALLDITKM